RLLVLEHPQAGARLRTLVVPPARGGHRPVERADRLVELLAAVVLPVVLLGTLVLAVLVLLALVLPAVIVPAIAQADQHVAHGLLHRARRRRGRERGGGGRRRRGGRRGRRGRGGNGDARGRAARGRRGGRAGRGQCRQRRARARRRRGCGGDGDARGRRAGRGQCRQRRARARGRRRGGRGGDSDARGRAARGRGAGRARGRDGRARGGRGGRRGCGPPFAVGVVPVDQLVAVVVDAIIARRVAPRPFHKGNHRHRAVGRDVHERLGDDRGHHLLLQLTHRERRGRGHPHHRECRTPEGRLGAVAPARRSRQPDFELGKVVRVGEVRRGRVAVHGTLDAARAVVEGLAVQEDLHRVTLPP